ncbi:hypothetical protein B0H13DRAFT_1924013 [Mycena leptocephala]|nr:hypothetical protein B0H13DRAFT_1924013 [Mycena leptocephala]
MAKGGKSKKKQASCQASAELVRHGVNFLATLARTYMTGKDGPPLGVGNSFPVWKEREGRGQIRDQVDGVLDQLTFPQVLLHNGDAVIETAYRIASASIIGPAALEDGSDCECLCGLNPHPIPACLAVISEQPCAPLSCEHHRVWLVSTVEVWPPNLDRHCVSSSYTISNLDYTMRAELGTDTYLDDIICASEDVLALQGSDALLSFSQEFPGECMSIKSQFT